MKVSPGLAVTRHHDPVREHARAAGNGGKIAARLADDRSRFAGDRALIDRGCALDAPRHRPECSRPPPPARHRRDAARLARTATGARAILGIASFFAITVCFKPRSAAACALLRPSANASAKFAKSSVNQSQIATFRMNQPGASPGPRAPAATARGQNAADVDDEHHWVAPLHARIELTKRIERAPATSERSNMESL